MKRVIGLGGIFFKSSNPAELRDWYKKHLGLNTQEWGTTFNWKAPDEETGEACSVWNPFKNETNYFEPSQKQFMINYVVHDLDALLEQLKIEGVKIIGDKQESEYGKFGWILDPEENKIELWEPPKKQ